MAHSNKQATPAEQIARFWAKTVAVGSCLVWTGGKVDGYGSFRISFPKRSRVRAARWIYEQAIGPIGKLYLLHSCDNPGCVALQHLMPGTQKQNIRDAINRGRRAYGAATNTTALTEADVREIRRLKAEGWTQYALGKKFGVSQPSINDIVHRKRWKHVI